MATALSTPLASSPVRWPLRIVLLGNAYNALSIECLERLVAAGHDVRVGVYDATTRGPLRLARSYTNARGRSFVVRKAIRLAVARTRLVARRLHIPMRGALSLDEACRAHRLRMFLCADPNTPAFVSRLRAEDADIIVIASFGRILKKRAFTAARLGCVNVHPSLLPAYRGPYPNYWVLANGEKTTGVTLHWVDAGVDTGPIISQLRYPVERGDTEARLDAKAARAAADLLVATLPLVAAGTAPRTTQDDRAATYYSFPTRLGAGT